MRIANLVPSATELCFALGLGDQVVAVTHECDFPPAATELPVLTRSVIEEGLSAAAIDAAVRARTERGEALYELDEARLAELEPDLIVTQAVCAVCAVAYEDVVGVAGRLPSRPQVLSLDPATLTEVLADAERLGAAAGRPELGLELRRRLEARIEAVGTRVSASGRRPRVAALEWLDPIFAGGHWVPEMIAAAGGVDVLAKPGERSRVITADELRAATPEVVVVMPCGLYCDEAVAESKQHLELLESLGAESIHAVDAAASFSRPGPRLADGVELLAAILHPETGPARTTLRSAEIRLTA